MNGGQVDAIVAFSRNWAVGSRVTWPVINACDALGYGENCFDAVVCSSIGINQQYACNFCESGHCKANPDNDKKVMCEKSDGTEQEEEKTRGKKWFKAKGLKFQGLRERNNKVPRTSHLRTGGN